MRGEEEAQHSPRPAAGSSGPSVSFYLWLGVGRVGGRGRRALRVCLRLRLLLVYLVDGGGDVGGRKRRLFFLPFLLAASVRAVHPLSQTLGQREVGG